MGYRFFAQRSAGKLNVHGYVKNLADGRVEVYAVGSPEQLQAMRKELQRGPSFANVAEVAEVEAEFLDAFAGRFSIEHED